MTEIRAVVSDFGGVLTSPLAEAFAAAQEALGISLEQLGQGMADAAERHGENPLFGLERGRLSETDFMRMLSESLAARLGHPVQMERFGERLLENLHPNEPMIEYLRTLQSRGLKLAICTNNVREWEERWRAKLAVDEIFDLVVDSAFVGARKPEPRIYEVLLERLATPARATLLIDDLEVNCEGARAMGMQAIHFRTTEQAIAEAEQALAEGALDEPASSERGG